MMIAQNITLVGRHSPVIHVPTYMHVCFCVLDQMVKTAEEVYRYIFYSVAIMWKFRG